MLQHPKTVARGDPDPGAGLWGATLSCALLLLGAQTRSPPGGESVPYPGRVVLARDCICMGKADPSVAFGADFSQCQSHRRFKLARRFVLIKGRIEEGKG